MNSSDLQSVQLRLNEVEGSLARLLNHLPGMAYRCTANSYDYTMVFVSSGSLALLGLSPAAVMANPTNLVEKMMSTEHLANVRRRIRESVENRTSYELFYKLHLPDDQSKWIWDQGEGVYDREGNCIFLEGIMMDVTEQKERELLLKKENNELRSSFLKARSLGKIIGKSKPMQDVYSLILKAAKSDTNVMINGETGVGKDLIAKTIHEFSRLKGRYVPVNCAAIPEQLLESEFFGHVKGAFSGATSNRMGYLAAADKGTLFLDEIGELPVNLQVKLLRALESKTYTPVGSSEVRSSHFRLISATNQDLEAMVAQKTMRADFFYRINVLTLRLPPLRERLDDLPLLIRSYAEHKRVATVLPPALLAQFLQYPWPGNVRELHNVLERFWTFGENALLGLLGPVGGGPAAGLTGEGAAPMGAGAIPGLHSAAQGFPEAMPYGTHAPQVTAIQPGAVYRQPLASPQAVEGVYDTGQNGVYFSSAVADVPLYEAKNDEEKRRILITLAQCSWRMGRAAEALGISLRTLQRKVKKYGIAR